MPDGSGLSFSASYRVLQVAGRRAWTATIASYRYGLCDRDGREVLSYHWHPNTHSHVTTPHLHLGGGVASWRFDLSARRHLYPDVSVSYDERDHADEGDAVAHPTLVVEVLSGSTEAYDRGDKVDLYRGKESLREYMLVSASRMGVDVYRREDDGGWKLSPVAPNGEVALESVGFRCPIEQFYEDVVLLAE